MLLFQVSPEKEDEGLAGLLPGGERVSARGWRAPPDFPTPGSSWQPPLYLWRGQEGDSHCGPSQKGLPRICVHSRLDPKEARSLFPWLIQNLRLEATCPFRHVFLPTQCLKCFLIYCQLMQFGRFLIKFSLLKPLNTEDVARRDLRPAW